MFAIARDTLVSSRRSANRRHALNKRLGQELLTANNAADLTGDVAHDTTDPRTDFQRLALYRLKPIDRELLSLIHWDFLTVSEAAQLLGLSAAAARSRDSRARATLKRVLQVSQITSRATHPRD